MAKLDAVIITIIGLLLVLVELKVLASVTAYNGWLIAIGVLVIGVSRLIRYFQK